MENSKIEWCHHTFQPWEGCEKVSAGCANCYAERRDQQYHRGAHWGPQGTRKMMSESYWKQPLKWNRDAEQAGERRRVFCASLADVFEDRYELVTPRQRLFTIIRKTSHLDWLLLTKRPRNIIPILDIELRTLFENYDWQVDWMNGEAPANVWLGATVENQEQADKRIPELLKVPAAVRFLSCEPLLGPLDLRSIKRIGVGSVDVLSGVDCSTGEWDGSEQIDWVIAGGESGPNARPTHPQWLRSLRDQCQAAGVAFHFKQHGEWAQGLGPAKETCWMTADGQVSKNPARDFADGRAFINLHRHGKHATGRTLDGRTWDELPRV